VTVFGTFQPVHLRLSFARLKEENYKAKKAAKAKETTIRCDLKSEKRKSDDMSAEVKRLRGKVLQVRVSLCSYLYMASQLSQEMITLFSSLINPLKGLLFKLFGRTLRTPGGLFLGVWYAGGIDFRRFRTPSLPIFGIILDTRNDEDV